MMLDLPVDEAYAFDYLSILEVKMQHDSRNRGKFMVFAEVAASLKRQLRGELFQLIKISKEYQELVAANKRTFEAVDRAKKDEVTASFVDECNYHRYLAKQALQKRFFKGPLKESKIGYERYKKP